MDIENFEKAFDRHIGSCRGTCECGQTFYNSSGDWTWEDGELDDLENDPKAHDIDYAIGRVMFEGKEYVRECGCWQERAKQIMGFIDSHAQQIADYLNAEKARKIKEAEMVATVECDG